MSAKFLTDTDRLNFLLEYFYITPPADAMTIPVVAIRTDDLGEDLTWGPMVSSARANQCHLGDMRAIIDHTIRKSEEARP